MFLSVTDHQRLIQTPSRTKPRLFRRLLPKHKRKLSSDDITHTHLVLEGQTSSPVDAPEVVKGFNGTNNLLLRNLQQQSLDRQSERKEQAKWSARKYSSVAEGIYGVPPDRVEVSFGRKIRQPSVANKVENIGPPLPLPYEVPGCDGEGMYENPRGLGEVKINGGVAKERDLGMLRTVREVEKDEKGKRLSNETLGEKAERLGAPNRTSSPEQVSDAGVKTIAQEIAGHQNAGTVENVPETESSVQEGYVEIVQPLLPVQPVAPKLTAIIPLFSSSMARYSSSSGSHYSEDDVSISSPIENTNYRLHSTLPAPSDKFNSKDTLPRTQPLLNVNRFSCGFLTNNVSNDESIHSADYEDFTPQYIPEHSFRRLSTGRRKSIFLVNEEALNIMSPRGSIAGLTSISETLETTSGDNNINNNDNRDMMSSSQSLPAALLGVPTANNVGADTRRESLRPKRAIIWQEPADYHPHHHHNSKHYDIHRDEGDETVFKPLFVDMDKMHTVDGETFFVRGLDKIPVRLVKTGRTVVLEGGSDRKGVEGVLGTTTASGRDEKEKQQVKKKKPVVDVHIFRGDTIHADECDADVDDVDDDDGDDESHDEDEEGDSDEDEEGKSDEEGDEEEEGKGAVKDEEKHTTKQDREAVGENTIVWSIVNDLKRQNEELVRRVGKLENMLKHKNNGGNSTNQRQHASQQHTVSSSMAGPRAISSFSHEESEKSLEKDERLLSDANHGEDISPMTSTMQLKAKAQEIKEKIQSQQTDATETNRMLHGDLHEDTDVTGVLATKVNNDQIGRDATIKTGNKGKKFMGGIFRSRKFSMSSVD